MKYENLFNFMYICLTRKIKEFQSVSKNCIEERFSVKNMPRNLLKEAGPPSQMRSGPGYFSCTGVKHFFRKTRCWFFSCMKKVSFWLDLVII